MLGAHAGPWSFVLPPCPALPQTESPDSKCISTKSNKNPSCSLEKVLNDVETKLSQKSISAALKCLHKRAFVCVFPLQVATGSSSTSPDPLAWLLLQFLSTLSNTSSSTPVLLTLFCVLLAPCLGNHLYILYFQGHDHGLIFKHLCLPQAEERGAFLISKN